MIEKLPKIQILITTNDQYIEGELIIPENIKINGSEPDNILFYVLNSGFQFVTLRNVEVKDRKNLSFRPDKSIQIHVNISSIISVQILDVLSDDDETQIGQ